MFYGVIAASLQDVVEAYKVRLDIGIRIGNRVAHAGLSRQVHHHGGLVLCKDAVNGSLVGQITLDKYPFVSVGTINGVYLVQPEVFESDIIIVVHVVKSHDSSTLRVLE